MLIVHLLLVFHSSLSAIQHLYIQKDIYASGDQYGSKCLVFCFFNQNGIKLIDNRIFTRSISWGEHNLTEKITMKIKPNYMGPNLKTTHVYILYDNPDT